MKYTITSHALEKVRERLGLSNKNKQYISEYINNLILESEYITDTTATDGNTCSMFVNDGIAIYIDKNNNTIVTVNKFKKATYCPLYPKIVEMHKKEIRKLDRKEQAVLNKIRTYDLESAVKLAQLELRKHKTRSNNVKRECMMSMDLIKGQKGKLKSELDEVRDAKKKIANSLAQYL